MASTNSPLLVPHMLVPYCCFLTPTHGLFSSNSCKSACFTRLSCKSEEAGTVEQGAQRSCGCPITVSVQGQARWGFEVADGAEDVPAHGRGLDEAIFEDAFQPRPLSDSKRSRDSLPLLH